MIKVAKILGWTFLVLILLLAVVVTYTIGWRPLIGPRARPLTNFKFQSTPERLVRGRYLVEDVTACMVCHSPHDWTKRDTPVPPGMEAGGQDMSLLKGLPGRIVAPNISPDPETGAGDWTDDMLKRAIREGIGHDGRSLPAVRNQLPPTQLIFPVGYLIRSVPQLLSAPVPQPDLSTPLKRGDYLVTIASCADCHTPQDGHGQPLPGMDYGGGLLFEGPWGRVFSANITPEPSGIPYYDLELFTQGLRTGYVKARPLNQIMSWGVYGGMTDEDIAAVFAKIKTLKPVVHHVDNAEPPTYCKLDKLMHGGGNQN